MILTDYQISMNCIDDLNNRSAGLNSDFRIEPFNPLQVEPASYDFRLSDTFRVFKHQRIANMLIVDPLKLDHRLTETVHVGGPGEPEHYDLLSGEFILGSSVETFTFGPNTCGVCMGKSSLARIGLIIENAGLFDPGFTGTATLEIVNIAKHTIRLTPRMLIGQMVFHRTEYPSRYPYGSIDGRNRYQGQQGPTEARNTSKDAV